ncbi:hypothetical protein V6N13_138114 [Hibiscus sabdariffa]
MEGEKGTVCVTGGTGFIASWLIKTLLEQGYSVHTTIRPDPENKKDISFLTSLPGAPDKLKIFTADLRYPDSFDAAIQGCKGLVHTASPMPNEFANNESHEEVLVQRAIDGTLGILKACSRSKTMKRVLCISGMASVYLNNEKVDVMDESFWTDVDYASEMKDPFGFYVISKTLIEKAVLQFAAEHGLDLVTVIPSLVVGPFICPTLSDSLKAALAPVFGKKDDYSFLLNMSMVHVDDLARAFVFLLQHPGPTGRYICSSDTVTIQKIVEILSNTHPEFTLPTAETLAEIEGSKMPGVTSKKLMDLGFRFNYGVQDMYDGVIKCYSAKTDGQSNKMNSHSHTAPSSTRSSGYYTKCLELQQLIAGKSTWKVLIMDKVTVKVMSHSCKVADITDQGVSLVEDLFRRRQPLPTMDAIYFMQPTREKSLLTTSTKVSCQRMNIPPQKADKSREAHRELLMEEGLPIL